MKQKNTEAGLFALPKWAWIALVVVVFGTGVLALFPQLHTDAQNPSNSCAPRRLTGGWANTDFCNASIEDWDEIISGGPGKDGIPAITDPDMESVEAAQDWLVAQSPVIAVEIDGEARAYPQAILMWHEIANDTINGVPVSVTFCPLCNSSIVFDRRVGDAILEFGVSGNLRHSDMVMYDRNTDSWWQQFTGEGIVGHYNGALLEIVPSRVIGFGQFAERYPDGLVMSRNTGHGRSYGRNPYVAYDRTQSPFLFRGDVDERLPAVERVLAGVINDEAIAYPFSVLQERFVINDVRGGEPVVAFWQPGTASALDLGSIDDSRDIGTTALYRRVVEGQTLTFMLSDTGDVVDAETGSTWNLFGEAIAGPLQGQTLRQMIAAPHFWFAWAAFHPETAVYLRQ